MCCPLPSLNQSPKDATAKIYLGLVAVHGAPSEMDAMEASGCTVAREEARHGARCILGREASDALDAVVDHVVPERAEAVAVLLPEL